MYVIRIEMNVFQIKADENDTEKVLHYLSCKDQEDILTRMERIQGEWAFIYIDVYLHYRC